MAALKKLDHSTPEADIGLSIYSDPITRFASALRVFGQGAKILRITVGRERRDGIEPEVGIRRRWSDGRCF